MTIKKFKEFVSQDSVILEDMEYYRGVEKRPDDIKFELIIWDGAESALLRDKSTNKIYLTYIDTSDKDFREYVEIPRELIGTDRDGFGDYDEMDWDDSYVDDEAIEAYTTDLAKKEGLGKGLDGFEEGKVTEVDTEYAKELISDSISHLKRLNASGNAGRSFFRMEKIEPLENFIEVLMQKFNLTK